MKDRVRIVWNSIWIDIRGVVKTYPFACAFAITGVVFSLLVFSYKDGISLTAWSVEVWDAITEGSLHDYSANIRSAHHGALTARYILMLLPWAIWNIPLWLTHPLSGNLEVTSELCMLWSKLGLLVCAFITGLLCCKVAFQITKEKMAGWTATILFLGSGTLAISIGIFAQDEIFYIMALMCAFNDVLRGRHRWSLFWMTIAVSLMPAMILPCLLFILYSFEKLVSRIASLVIISTPYVLNQIFVPGSIGSDDYLALFFKISTFSGGYSTFGVIVCLLVALQFFNVYKTKDEEKRHLLFHVTCLMVAMGLFSWSHPYRYFLCMPFLTISVVSIQDFEKRIAGIAGICVFEYCRFICTCFADYWFWPFDLSELAQRILKIEPYRNITMYSLLTKYFPILSGKEYLILAMTCACGFWLIWIINPDGKQEIKCKFLPQIIINIYSVCAILFVALFCILLYKTDITMLSINNDDFVAPAITDTNGLCEYYYTKDSANAVAMTIRPVTWSRDYPDDQMLCVDIVDTVNDEIVGTTSIFADELPDNQPFQIEIANISIKKNHWYIFRLYSSETIRNSEHYIYLLCTDAGTANPEKHYAAIWEEKDGVFTYVTTDYDIFCEIIAR